MPEGIAILLYTVRVLLTYGRHLAATANRRSATHAFNIIAACFGTRKLPTILAHVQRGILRAMALERVLLARAAQGREVPFVKTRSSWEDVSVADSAGPAEAAQPAPGAATADAAPADSAMPADAAPALLAAARPRVARPRRHPGWDDPLIHMPSLEELEAEIRRRPFGHTVIAICLDLAVLPGLCSRAFGNLLLDITLAYGGRESRLMEARQAGRKAFEREQDRVVGSNWEWVGATGEAVRQALGFLIGEDPVEPGETAAAPFLPAAAIATGPP
jgi:hypothetical protein